MISNLNSDAFSSGQIGSKIWLCEELERLGWASNQTYICGGWYGLTAFLLLSRGNFKVNSIRSIDQDPECQAIADDINNLWVWQQWKFKAFTGDCNTMIFPDGVDIVINTSTEHFDSRAWFDSIPSGTRVVLQSNNMPHEDHCVSYNTAAEFAADYNLSTVDFVGAKDFVYPDWSFTRFMLIGTK